MKGKGIGCLVMILAFAMLPVIGALLPERELTPVEKAERAKAETRLAVAKKCRAEIRAQLKYASTADFDTWSEQIKEQSPGVFLVRTPFKAQNGFGMMIPQVGYCEVRGGEATVLAIADD